MWLFPLCQPSLGGRRDCSVEAEDAEEQQEVEGRTALDGGSDEDRVSTLSFMIADDFFRRALYDNRLCVIDRTQLQMGKFFCNLSRHFLKRRGKIMGQDIEIDWKNVSIKIIS